MYPGRKALALTGRLEADDHQYIYRTERSTLQAHIQEPQAHLTTTDLADRWRCSAGHLANLRSERKGLAYLRLGGRVVYRLNDVLAYEARCLVPSVAA